MKLPGSTSTLVGLIAVASGLVPLCLWFIYEKKRIRKEFDRILPEKLVVITGCDSGLGLAMSYWAVQKGYKVMAGCYNLESSGAQFLKNAFTEDLLQLSEVDVTKPESLKEFSFKCQNILEASGSPTILWAVIPNAAVGAFGEFFWMTDTLSRRIMEVNFWGTLNLTQTFHPLMLHYKSRLIVITSDCADFPLPGLSIYSASKAALQNWAEALRLEVAKFGIFVTSFQPGNFPTQSRLFAGQRHVFEEMKSSLSAEDQAFYGDYFNAYNTGLIRFLETPSATELRHDHGIRRTFLSLLEKDLKFLPVETRNPLSLRLIHALFKYLPIRASDWLKIRLLGPPIWHKKHYPLIKN